MQAAIFDMDGVLLDNLEYHLLAFQQLGREQGRELTRLQIEGVFGRKNDDMLQALLERSMDRAELDRLADRKEAIYRELAAPHVVRLMVPGLLGLLGELAAAEVPMAVATSGPPENVALVFEGLGIRRHFCAVVTGGEVERGKPHPDIFLKAAGLAGVDPVRCVVFEDSRSGIQAALASGGRCVALATTHPVEELRDLEPHMIVRDFQGLGIDTLKRLWPEQTGPETS